MNILSYLDAVCEKQIWNVCNDRGIKKLDFIATSDCKTITQWPCELEKMLYLNLVNNYNHQAYAITITMKNRFTLGCVDHISVLSPLKKIYFNLCIYNSSFIYLFSFYWYINGLLYQRNIHWLLKPLTTSVSKEVIHIYIHLQFSAARLFKYRPFCGQQALNG